MRCVLVAIVVASSSAVAGAQPVPSYGIDFVTIGAPGNRHTIPSEVPEAPWVQRGAVSYEYRLSRTEITIGQFAEFVTAYQAVRPELYLSIDASDVGQNTYLRVGPSGADYNPAHAQYPNQPSWRMAARFCNWLHNGKVNELWAFESGAYDTSTFGLAPDGFNFTDQFTRSPGARFWIPSINEWVKGTFYDPNRYGAGQGGYWPYTNSSEHVPISGLPGQGGETNAGINVPPGGIMNVGSYPSFQSPWGLLDTSGGTAEFTEDYRPQSTRRWSVGTFYGDWGHFVNESPVLGGSSGYAPDRGGFVGLRLASAVPAPGTLVIGLCAAIGLPRRSRREDPYSLVRR
jgi:hypothetical protein